MANPGDVTSFQPVPDSAHGLTRSNPPASESPNPISQEAIDLFNLSLDLLCVAGFDGYFKRVNPAFERILGYSTTKLISQPFLEFIHPDDYATSQAELEKLRTGITITVENRYLTQSGEYRWIAWTATPVLERQLIYGVGRDITERKQLEAALQQTNQELEQRVAERTLQLEKTNAEFVDRERLYRTLAQHIPNGSVVLFDHELRYLLCEGGELARIGLDAQTMVGKTIWDVFPADVCQLIEPQYRAALSGEVRSQEISFQDQVYETQCVPIRNESGEIVSGMVLTQNTTQRKLAEEQLAQTNSILRAVIDGASDVIFVKDLQGRYVIVNPTIANWFGCSIDQVLGKDDAALFPPEIAQKVQDCDRYVMQTQEVITVEEQVPKQGELRSLLTTKYPWRDTQGSVLGVIGIGRDVSEQKQAEVALRQSEERLRGFVESNIIGILFGDVDGGVFDANDEFLRIIGYTREDLETNQIRWTNITPPEYLPIDAERIAEAQERGACTPYEKEYIRKNGDRVPVLVGYNLFGEGRTRSVAFILDIAELKQLEQTLRQQTEDLVRANRLKDEFLAILSHELKTPLNPILGWTKLLRTGKLNPDQQQQALETIERNAKLQAQLVEDLLDISRILRGKLALKLANVNLVQPIKAAIDTVRLAAEAKSITLEPMLDPCVGIVRGDVSRLQQIVGNLLSNAVKFTPEEGHITIRLERVAQKVQLQVMDTGRGIRADFLPFVFERFRQEDGSTTRKYGGLGLGLAIVKQLVEAHGGTITAESPGEGQGATFTVRLPVFSDTTLCNLSSDDTVVPDLNGTRILIIDDDPDSLAFAAFVLGQAGAIVTPVSTAAEVYRYLVESSFDVLMSDIGMPEVNGYALIKQVRAMPNGRELTAIALTAYTGEFNQQQAKAAGFDEHLGKPIDPVELVNAIKTAVTVRAETL